MPWETNNDLFFANSQKLDSYRVKETAGKLVGIDIGDILY